MLRKRIPWLIVTGLMVSSLVLAACGTPQTEPAPAPTPSAPTPTPSPTPTPTPTPSPMPTASTGTPKHGGTITYRLASDPTNFDSGTLNRGGALGGTVYQALFGTDWLRGPAGSGVTNLAAGGVSIEDGQGMQIAESWKMPAKGVYQLQIRQGIRWQPVNSEAGRLMNGRELTADDVVASFNRLHNRDPKTPAPNSWIVTGQPTVARTANITKTGPWEVTITTPQEFMTAYVWIIQGNFFRMYPPEVVAKYGSMSNWRNAVGTGPYMLTDYVPGSALVYQKNPNYWEKDPAGPGEGNQLPYADTLRELIIPDYSTTLAALRTGKLDLQSGVVLTDAQELWKTAPGLEYTRYLNGSYAIGMRTDKKELPFSDVRVRRALMMATDFESIKRDYYGGEAEIVSWPANSTQTSIYEPLDKMPASIQELYKYNPDKAKQLLTEAGYPNGFKAKILVINTAARIDDMSIIKDMWSKIGVDLTLDIKEAGSYNPQVGAGTPYEEMVYRWQTSPFLMHLYQAYTRGPAILNVSHINDPPGTDKYLEDLFLEQDKLLFVDMPAVYEDVKKVNRYVMDQSFAIPWPVPNLYNFWWPWLKNYYGAGVGLVKYSWIDQDLKKSMGY